MPSRPRAFYAEGNAAIRAFNHHCCVFVQVPLPSKTDLLVARPDSVPREDSHCYCLTETMRILLEVLARVPPGTALLGREETLGMSKLGRL